MRRVDVPAGTIEYDDLGSGPPVVLLHGLLMDHTVWDPVVPRLPSGYRYLRPTLPLGAHRIAMRAGADLSLSGQVELVADLLEALDLDDVTLVHSDWGGALFLTAHERDTRVARQVVLPCEAFENFPPGLPGRMAALVARIPGGLRLVARQLRVARLRRLPMIFGQMARDPIPDDVVRRWTAPVLSDDGVLRDLRAYATSRIDRDATVRDTEAIAHFGGDVLVLWSPDNRVMPPDHGRRLAELAPRGRLVEIPGARVLSMLDEPDAVAREMTAFLAETSSRRREGHR